MRQMKQVVLIVTCTPTANSMLVMAELAGQPGATEVLAVCKFTQYACAPFVLSASISVFIATVESFGGG